MMGGCEEEDMAGFGRERNSEYKKSSREREYRKRRESDSEYRKSREREYKRRRESDSECRKSREREYKKRRERDSEYEKGGRRRRAWSDLPEDILVSLMERHYVADRKRFRAVCKNWNAIIKSTTDYAIDRIDKLPWTMEYKWRNPDSKSNDRSSCKLYEPIFHHNRTLSYFVEDGRIYGRKSFVDPRVHASRDGWVLFEKVGRPNLFFFNPFTRKVINLPHHGPSSVSTATFTSAPDSPDSNCFVFVSYTDSLEFCVQLYSHADKTWKKNTYHTSLDNGILSRDTCYVEEEGGGKFYCILESFQLWIFDVNNFDQEPTIIITTTYQPFKDSIHNIFECDGDFFLVFYLGSPRVLPVLKLDQERKEWVRVSSLEGRAMFLGKISLCISAGGETERIANRVYSYQKGVLCFKTLNGSEDVDDDGNDTGSVSSNDEDDDSTLSLLGWKRERKARIYGCCMDEREIIWIRPPKN